jgi:hypothetical protein
MLAAQEAVLTDSLISFQELANLFGFSIEAVVAAVDTQRQRASARQAFFTISQLKDRWQCSRAHVYGVLRASGMKVLDIGQGKERSKTRVPAETVARIEKARMEKIQ